MDREISMKLFEATTDDDGKVADTVSKPICKAAIKAKEPALLDMAKWLVDEEEAICRRIADPESTHGWGLK